VEVDAKMTCRKRIETSPKFLPVYLSGCLLPGIFENEVSANACVSNAKVKNSGRIMPLQLVSGPSNK
jgi:hypothetical protein